jgi:DNA-directed RNA polymerase specialized sigma24 family protein
MEAELVKAMQKNARVVVGRYKRKCWWASAEDLVQEAICAQLQALTKFDKTRGTPRDAYLFYAALYSARRALLKASAPVSTSHDVNNLKGLSRADVMEIDGVIHVEPADFLQRRNEIHRAVVECLGDESADFAYAMLADGWHPNEVAAAHGYDPHDVYAAVGWVRSQLGSNDALCQMWSET